MKKLIYSSVAAVILLCFLLTGTSQAQGGKGGAGWGAGSTYNKLYNPSSVETLSGEVMKVETYTLRKGMAKGTHLILKTDKETIPVHLGPSSYLERQNIMFEPGERIEVMGSRINFNGKPAIIAAEVKKGPQLITLRDANGVPAWSRRG